MPFNLNLIIILFTVLRSQQLELTSMACMYVIQDVISAAVLSGTYTATGQISELCKNGDWQSDVTAHWNHLVMDITGSLDYIMNVCLYSLTIPAQADEAVSLNIMYKLYLSMQSLIFWIN